jgi:hypothetical protein
VLQLIFPSVVRQTATARLVANRHLELAPEVPSVLSDLRPLPPSLPLFVYRQPRATRLRPRLPSQSPRMLAAALDLEVRLAKVVNGETAAASIST